MNEKRHRSAALAMGLVVALAAPALAVLGALLPHEHHRSGSAHAELVEILVHGHRHATAAPEHDHLSTTPQSGKALAPRLELDRPYPGVEPRVPRSCRVADELPLVHAPRGSPQRLSLLSTWLI